MKSQIYYAETIFDFGAHKGKSLKEVLLMDFSYINWCIKTLDWFCIEPSEIEKIKNKSKNCS